MSLLRDRADEALRIVGRLIVLALISASVLFLFGIALKPVFPDGLPPGRDGQMLLSGLLAVAIAVGHVAIVPIFEKGEWRATGIGANGWHPLGLAAGAVTGIVGVLVAGALLLATDQAQFVPAPSGAWTPFALSLLGTFATFSLTEELMFRGYTFGVLTEFWGGGAAILVTSLAFGALHGLNPGATPATLLGVVVAGVFLGAVRLWTGSLAAVWLAHLGLNWAQGALLRAPVSGLEFAPSPNLRFDPTGPAWLTGGAWGPEGGVATATSLALVTFLLLRARRIDPGPARRH